MKDKHGYEITNLMGNEIIELARTNEQGNEEAREIVRRALAGDDEAVILLSPWMNLAREYAEKGQI